MNSFAYLMGPLSVMCNLLPCLLPAPMCRRPLHPGQALTPCSGPDSSPSTPAYWVPHLMVFVPESSGRGRESPWWNHHVSQVEVSGFRGHKPTSYLFFSFPVRVDCYVGQFSHALWTQLHQEGRICFRSSSVIRDPEATFCPKSCLSSVIKICSTISS